MKQKILSCKHCGNLAALLQDAGVPLVCCGEEMHRVQPGSVEAAGEKHLPVYRKQGSSVYVQVGAVPHPMTREHYIQWICLETTHMVQYAHLQPEEAPEAVFALSPGEEILSVCAFCNQHELWRK